VDGHARTGKRATTPRGKESWKEARTVIEIRFESSYIGHVTGKPEPPAELPTGRELYLSRPLNPEVIEMEPENRSELVARAVTAARRARDTDRDRFPERQLDWRTWELRARQGRALAAALGVPVDQVSVIDDPQRLYGAVPGDLLIVTDPDDAHRWRFVPDLGATETWLLLDECPDCEAHVPITRVATLADLGAYLDAEDPDYDPTNGCPEEFHTDPAHHPDCGLST
jgi:hypothetical protein